MAIESELAGAWGILTGYRDVEQRWHEARPESVSALLKAMDARPGTAPSPSPSPSRGGQEGGPPQRSPAHPPPCYLPAGLRTWGLAAQLYAVRSQASWGIGDLADLRRLAAWSKRSAGAGTLLVNPLHAALPFLPQEPSPYYPSSRRFRNPLYIRVEEVPGWPELAAELEPLARAGRDLNSRRQIDRDSSLLLKLQALERLWALFAASPSAGFEQFRGVGGRSLDDHATFCAIAEAEGSPWRQWPAGLRHPRAPAVAAFAREHRDRVLFHAWLQWLLDEQLGKAGQEIGLVTDLAIGVDPAGADAWADQDLLLQGFTMGAPPDPFNAAGQSWQLAAFDPWRMREAGHEPLRDILRAGFRHAAGMRIDHVMGFWRLYLIPNGAGPEEGVYLRQGGAEALVVLAEESHRAQAFVVGEDLGTVDRSFRAKLARLDILGYRLVWFERRRPGRYPALSLAAVGTHDLPTVAGVWSGADGNGVLRDRLRRCAGVPEDASLEEVFSGAYAALAASPSMLVGVSLEDVLGVAERPNQPGTTVAERPNWSVALPQSLEEIEAGPAARQLTAAMGRRFLPPQSGGSTGRRPGRGAP